MSGTVKRSAPSKVPTDKSTNKKQKGVDKKLKKEIEHEKMLKSQEPLADWLSCFEREAGIESPDQIGEDEVGTIIFTRSDRRFCCCFTAIGRLLDNEEITSSDSSSTMKEMVESEFGPISEFPVRLEELAAMLLEGAKLARDAGIDKIKEWDEDEACEDEDDDEDDDEDGKDEDGKDDEDEEDGN